MRLVLLGDPVSHSRSPAIHQAALRHLGVAGSYHLCKVDAAGLAEAVADMRAGHLDGANVTMPHKRTAAALCDELSADAARVRAVNTLVRRDGGRIAGHLTDVSGIRRAWQKAALPDEASILLLGAGGAAGAALLAMEGRRISVSARRPGRATKLLKEAGVAGREVPWGAAVPGAVVVNATPLGMHGEPLPAPVLAAAAGLFDMAYGPATTPAVTAFRGVGLPVAAGIDMLVAQAAVSFELWTGRPAPEAVMRAAATAGMSQDH